MLKVFPLALVALLSGCSDAEPPTDDGKHVYLSSIVNESSLSGELRRVYSGDDGYTVFETWNLTAGQTVKPGNGQAHWVSCGGMTFEFDPPGGWPPPRTAHGPSGSSCKAMAGQGLRVVIHADGDLAIELV